MNQRVLRPLCERIGRAKVDRVVGRFYERVRLDPQLAPYFAQVQDFASHERLIADFWWIAMGGRVADPPAVDMVGVHRPLGLSAEDLQHWLEVFGQVLDAELESVAAQQWLTMARGIGARLERIAVG